MAQTGRLQGRTGLIMGGTSGIGLATAGRFLVEGALVVVCGHSQKTVAEARAILEDVGRERILALAADASDPAQVEGLFQQVRAFFSGHLDILYHVAGISGRRGSATPRCTSALSRAGTQFLMPTRGACS
jgi:NAD(P)-dependent dehydrogenase (short-subunit alcohol dehydrogenase family)